MLTKQQTLKTLTSKKDWNKIDKIDNLDIAIAWVKRGYSFAEYYKLQEQDYDMVETLVSKVEGMWASWCM